MVEHSERQRIAILSVPMIANAQIRVFTSSTLKQHKRKVMHSMVRREARKARRADSGWYLSYGWRHAATFQDNSEAWHYVVRVSDG